MIQRLASLARGSELRTRAAAVSRLLFSTMVAQGAVFVALLVAAKWFDARDFALYGISFGLANIMSSGNTFAVETRLAVVPDHQVDGLTRVGGTTATGLSFLGLVGVAVSLSLGETALAVSIALAMVAAVLMGWQVVLTTVVLRRLGADVLARPRTVQGLTNAALVIGLGATRVPGYVALSGSWVISLVVWLALVLAVARPFGPATLRLPTRGDWMFAIRQVRYQPISNLLVGLAAQAPLILLPALASDSIAGSWALCTRFLSAAVVAGNASLQPVYYAEAAALARAARWDRLRQWHSMWTAGLAVGAVALFGSGGWVIALALPRLDPQWSGVGPVVLAGCVYWGTLFWSVPLSQTLQLIHAMGHQLAWSMARFTIAVGGFLAAAPLGGGAALLIWAVLCLAADTSLVVLQKRKLARLNHQRAETDFLDAEKPTPSTATP